MSDERISVSRDALRADLAELELRLQAFVRTELSSKADLSALETMRRDVDTLMDRQETRDRGEFTKAQLNAITNAVKDGAVATWSSRQQVATVVSAAAGVLALFVTAVLAFHGV